MPTIIDYSNVVVSVLVQDIAQSPRGVVGEASSVDDNFLRHMIINTIRSHVVKSRQYGETILACDGGGGSWRKDHFKNYKCRRHADKSGADQGGLDWDMVGRVLADTREDLARFFPVKVVRVDSCEADDIIGVAARLWPGAQKRLHIISGDKDFRQLQSDPLSAGGAGRVTQFSPTLKKDIIEDDPMGHLGLLVLKGDGGDDVPNLLSDDDTFFDKRKQGVVTAKKNEEFFRHWNRNHGELDREFYRAYAAGEIWTDYSLGKVDKKNPEKSRDPLPIAELERRIDRNMTMVDLRKTPSGHTDHILRALDAPIKGDVITAMQYLEARKMRRLLDTVGDWA